MSCRFYFNIPPKSNVEIIMWRSYRYHCHTNSSYPQCPAPQPFMPPFCHYNRGSNRNASAKIVIILETKKKSARYFHEIPRWWNSTSPWWSWMQPCRTQVHCSRWWHWVDEWLEASRLSEPWMTISYLLSDLIPCTSETSYPDETSLGSQRKW